MDRVVSAFEKWITSEESANEFACYHAAKLFGLTKEQADNCDAGEYDCTECPWGGKEK